MAALWPENGLVSLGVFGIRTPLSSVPSGNFLVTIGHFPLKNTIEVDFIAELLRCSAEMKRNYWQVEGL